MEDHEVSRTETEEVFNAVGGEGKSGQRGQHLDGCSDME